MNTPLYLASGLQNAGAVRALHPRVAREGFRITFDWTSLGPTSGDEARILIASSEAEGVLESEVVGAILPGGRGTYTEIGIGIGSKKPIVLWIDEATTMSEFPVIFNDHPLVTKVYGEDEFFRSLREAVSSRK